MFQHLTVKAFIALRPYADQLINTVRLMLDTDLPSFKGEGTIKRLRDRFALGMSERHAADWMLGLVKNAHENMRSTAYDEFQRVSLGDRCVSDSWLMMCSVFQFQNGISCSKSSFCMDLHLSMQVSRTSSDFHRLELVILHSVISCLQSQRLSRMGIQIHPLLCLSTFFARSRGFFLGYQSPLSVRHRAGWRCSSCSVREPRQFRSFPV